MFDIEATVTAATPTELNLTADWPIRWLEAAEGFEIQRKVVLKEILPEFDGTVKRLEIKSDRARWPNLCVGDQVIVRCFVEGESRRFRGTQILSDVGDEVIRGFWNIGTESPVKPLVQPRKCRLRFGTGVSCNEVHIIFEIATSSAFCAALGAVANLSPSRPLHAPRRSGTNCRRSVDCPGVIEPIRFSLPCRMSLHGCF